MTCYSPLTAWRSSSGKIVFSEPKDATEKLSLPCGQCVGCRLARSRDWAIRCVHEAQMHKQNSFITLTYNDEHLPKDGSLSVRHVQLFMKRLRKSLRVGRVGRIPVRFFQCGEYGEQTGRPHYHMCLFGYDFPDKKLWKVRENIRLYTSEKLNEIWGMGYCVIGDVTFESAAYVARYIMKKVTGDAASDYYTRVNPDTGEWWNIKPEFITMSRRPGIGYNWLYNYFDDLFPKDEVIHNGRKLTPPRYYTNFLKVVNPPLFDQIKFERFQNAILSLDDNTPDRLKVRQSVQEARLTKLPRGL